MSGTDQLEDDLENQGHHAALRAYERRLAEWLGLDVDEVLDLKESKTDEAMPVDSPGLRVRWGAWLSPVLDGSAAACCRA